MNHFAAELDDPIERLGYVADLEVRKRPAVARPGSAFVQTQFDALRPGLETPALVLLPPVEGRAEHAFPEPARAVEIVRGELDQLQHERRVDLAGHLPLRLSDRIVERQASDQMGWAGNAVPEPDLRYPRLASDARPSLPRRRAVHACGCDEVRGPDDSLSVEVEAGAQSRRPSETGHALHSTAEIGDLERTPPRSQEALDGHPVAGDAHERGASADTDVRMRLRRRKPGNRGRAGLHVSAQETISDGDLPVGLEIEAELDKAARRGPDDRPVCGAARQTIVDDDFAGPVASMTLVPSYEPPCKCHLAAAAPRCWCVANDEGASTVHDVANDDPDAVVRAVGVDVGGEGLVDGRRE